MNVAAIKRLAAVIMIHLKHGPGDFWKHQKKCLMAEVVLKP